MSAYDPKRTFEGGASGPAKGAILPQATEKQ